MKYLIMIHSNATSRARWETLTDAEREQFGRAHYALSDDLLESGHGVVSAGLMDPDAGRRVRVHDGTVVATDGPFAEAKEYLAGLYLVDCTDLDEATAIAARVPDAQFTEVEVRPVWDESLLDG